MTAVVVCNGSINDYTYLRRYFASAKFVICVDGGAAHMRKFGIIPHVLLGDFDSIKEEDLEYYKETSVEILEFSSKKDKTDTELAVELAIEKGFNEIIFVGGLGTRMDHSLSNVFILKGMLERGIKGIIVDEHNEITLTMDKIKIKKEINEKITLLSLSEETVGVTTKGLSYPLTDATLKMGSTWGVSNEFISDMAEITIKKGMLLVIKSID